MTATRTPVAEHKLAVAALAKFDAKAPAMRAKLEARVQAAAAALEAAMVPIRKLAALEAGASAAVVRAATAIGLTQPMLKAVRDAVLAVSQDTNAEFCGPLPLPEGVDFQVVLRSPNPITPTVAAPASDELGGGIAPPVEDGAEELLRVKQERLGHTIVSQPSPAVQPKPAVKRCAKCGSVGATCQCGKPAVVLSPLTILIRLTGAVGVKMGEMPTTLEQANKVLAKCKAHLVATGNAVGGAAALRGVANSLGLKYGTCKVAEHISNILSPVETAILDWATAPVSKVA